MKIPGSVSLATGAGLALMLAAPCAPARSFTQAAAQPGAAKQPALTVEGKLLTGGAHGLSIESGEGQLRLKADDPSLLSTLGDPQLGDRTVRLEGVREPDGTLNVHHLLVVRDGKLFRVRYYCHICNIPATEPGPCVCCHGPTELEEIPAETVTRDMVLVP